MLMLTSNSVILSPPDEIQSQHSARTFHHNYNYKPVFTATFPIKAWMLGSFHVLIPIWAVHAYCFIARVPGSVACVEY